MDIIHDLLTEDEIQLFLKKLSTYYHERDAKNFVEVFAYSPIDDIKRRVARFDGGFAVLDIYGSIMMSGKFYVLKDNCFYRVSTIAEDSKDFDSKTYVASVLRNGFETVTSDETIWPIFEDIRLFFVKDNTLYN